MSGFGSQGKAIVSRRRQKQGRREENVVPMINVIFLLLLYFMIAGNLSPDTDVPVAPPVSASESALPRHLPELAIDADGQLFLAGRALTTEALAGRLLVDGVPPEAVRIRADQAAAAGVLTAAIDALSAIGVQQLVLVTVREP